MISDQPMGHLGARCTLAETVFRSCRFCPSTHTTMMVGTAPARRPGPLPMPHGSNASRMAKHSVQKSFRTNASSSSSHDVTEQSEYVRINAALATGASDTTCVE